MKGLAALDAMEAFGETTSSVSAELEILRSRMILGAVVDKLQLDHHAAPSHFPMLGEAIARRYAGPGVAKPWFSREEYAWGGEDIRIERLDVPPSLLGEPLTLIAGQEGQFVLTDELAGWREAGRVGQPLRMTLPDNEPLALFVSRLKARPDTRFRLLRQSRNGAITALAGQLSVAEKGRGSGIVELRLTGYERAALPTILDEIMLVYVRQNVERRSAEAENSLQFLETQLPALKEQLDAAENAYNSYRLEEGSVDLDNETQTLLAAVVTVDNELVALQGQRKEMQARVTPEYPGFRDLDLKINQLQQRRSVLDKEVANLPGAQQKILRLKRDVEVSTRLYTELLKTAQQLRVAKAGTVGNVRVIDEAAVGSRPIAPRKSRMLAVSFVLGVLASLMLIWLIRNLHRKVEDADVIERSLGLPVYATVPHSKLEKQLSRNMKQQKATSGVLALLHEDEDAVESLRSLRTTLRFVMAESRKAGVMVTGPSQSIGKSFVSKNLAVLLAQTGDLVVLIDADMRRGHLHRDFSLPREGGLSEYLSQDLSVDDVTRSTSIDGLCVITCGARPPKPSELLMNLRFEQLIETLANRFQHIIIDAPPILAVSDAASIGRYAGVTMMVARAGLHPIQELEQSVKRLSLSGIKTDGFVLNDLDTRRLRYRYGYSGYHYQYKYK